MRRLALPICVAPLCVMASASPAAAADLTLHRVMLSAAGIGYFEYGGHQDGPGSFGLDVKLDQVDDVLRSLAVFDKNGGVGSIELPGRDNLRAAFADVPFKAADLGAPAALLESLRGEQLEVTGPAAMTGRILGTAEESVTQPLAGGATGQTVHTRVTLLTPEGLRQFILEDAAAIKLTDPALQAKLAAALDAARQQAASDSRHLTLRSQGAGPHDITVGYVAVAPLWKASYRVVLPETAGGTARVQGWAVLENQSGADWRGVDLTLQSGNPVTFHQAIYASYYADRPEVPAEVLGRLLPDADVRATLTRIGRGASQRAYRESNPLAYQPPGAPMEAAPPAPAAMASQAIVPGSQEDLIASAPAPLAQPQTAEAQENPTDTSFHIATPIDLPRGHTASVPIIDRDIPAEQLDWLQAYSTRPVSALRITNDSKTSLPAGVLTLYAQNKTSGTSFAGDARLSGLPAGENRLLAFAEDLRTTAERGTSSVPDMLLRVKMADGVLTQSLRRRISYTVTLTAPAQEPRRVLVEFPKTQGAHFAIESGDAEDQDATATAWRALVSLQPGQTRHVTAYSDFEVSNAAILLPEDGEFQGQVLAAVLAQGKLDAAARAKLQTLADLRATETTKRAALARLTADQDGVNQDEDRLRKNLEAVTGPGNLHDKLLNALETDEATLARLRGDIAHAQGEADQAHDALAAAVRKLSL